MLMGYQNNKFSILIICLSFFVVTGCTALQGKLTKTYESDYQAAVQASSDTLKTLRLPVTEEMSDELKTVFHAQRFDGTPVIIEVVRIERQLTEVTVRTGTGIVPDERVPTQIHEFINENLVQQSADDTKQTVNQAGITAPLDEAEKSEIIEENLEEDSTAEMIADEPIPNIDEPKQSEPPPKLAQIYTDSVFVIFFNQDSNALTAKAMQKLDEVAAIIFNNPQIKIALNGYSDSHGQPTYNKVVSENRANMVKIYLVGKGVDPSKITAVGYGAQNFLASNNTREGRQFNRRVEIEIKNPGTK